MGYSGVNPIYPSGANIAVQFTASGGIPPYSWDFSPETIVPLGLSIDGSGLMTGVVADGVYAITVVASDTIGQVGVDSLMLYVGVAPLTMPSVIPDPCLGLSYVHQLEIATPNLPVVFELFSGTLPVGISLSASGELSGTATIAGSYTFTIRAVDSGFSVGVGTYTLIVAVCSGNFSLNASSFASCFGSSFYFQLVASGGASPYTYTIPFGGLPPSLVLSGDTLLGVLTHSGSYSATVHVADSIGAEADFPLTFVVSPPLTLDVEGILPVVPSEPYSQQLIISGFQPGEGTISFDPVLLPDGLTFDSGTNTISGTTTIQSGVYPIVATLSVGDCVNTYSFSLIVYRLELDPITLCVLPNVPYYAKLFTLNGISPFTWELTGDALPDYLSLNTLTGEITGSAATETVTYTSVRVTDGLGNVASTSLTVTVSTICGELGSTTGGINVGAPPVAPGRAPWIPSLQSAIMVVGSGYFEDNLIKYLPTMYGPQS